MVGPYYRIVENHLEDFLLELRNPQNKRPIISANAEASFRAKLECGIARFGPESETPAPGAPEALDPGRTFSLPGMWRGSVRPFLLQKTRILPKMRCEARLHCHDSRL